MLCVRAQQLVSALVKLPSNNYRNTHSLSSHDSSLTLHAQLFSCQYIIQSGTLHVDMPFVCARRRMSSDQRYCHRRLSYIRTPILQNGHNPR